MSSAFRVVSVGKMLNGISVACRPVIRNNVIRNLYTSRPRMISVSSLSAAASLLIIRPAAKLFAMILGKSLRSHWKAVPFSVRRRLIWNKVKRNKSMTAATICSLATSWVVFYYLHIECVPVVGRKRFSPLTKYQYSKVTKSEEDLISNSLEKLIIDPRSSELSLKLYKSIGYIVKRILLSNSLIIPRDNSGWNIVLVEDDQANAFALPSGSIYVFTGLFKVVSNEHELAMVLAHEMSHVICGHGVENLTRGTLFDFSMTLFLASLWCIMPNDGIALVASWFSHKVAELLFKLPFSRGLESEADEVGLDLLSRACFDPRQAALIWLKMEILEEILEDYELEKGKSSLLTASGSAVESFIESTGYFLPTQDAFVTLNSKSAVDHGSQTIENLPTKTTDFFSTHPSSTDRYQNIAAAIANGRTAKAAQEGKCDDEGLKKPLPPGFDSRRKLRTELLQRFKYVLKGRQYLELK